MTIRKATQSIFSSGLRLLDATIDIPSQLHYTDMITIKYTHRKEFEEWVLEDFPLLVLISNERKVNFAQILREEKDQANSSVERRHHYRLK